MPTVYQCGFLAGPPGAGAAEPACSKDGAGALLPVAADPSLASAFPGGWGFALGADGAGAPLAWGVNLATMLGRKSGPDADAATDPAAAARVAGGAPAAAAAGGFDHALVVQDGAIAAFGPGLSAPGGLLARVALPGARAAAVAAGEHHSLALTDDGRVFAWGSNREGQLGAPGVGAASKEPVLVLGPGSGRHGDAVVTAIAAGARHSLALDAAGRCLAWGWALHGQCGAPAGGAPPPSVPEPALVAALGPLRCVSLAAGSRHSLVATDAGAVYGWGADGDGALGGGGAAAAPRLLEAPALDGEHVSKISAGARHSAALCASGRVIAWGHGAFGQLGRGGAPAAGAPAPVALPPGARAVDVACGWWHTLVVAE
jgi:hypothetical protein